MGVASEQEQELPSGGRRSSPRETYTLAPEPYTLAKPRIQTAMPPGSRLAQA